MIIVIQHTSYNKKTSTYQTVVSHGIDVDTDENVVLPSVSIYDIGARWNDEIGEWVLDHH